MFSDAEQRQLAEIESGPPHHDPRFAGAFVPGLAVPHRRRVRSAIAGAVAVVVTGAALVVGSVVAAVLGFCGVGAA